MLICRWFWSLQVLCRQRWYLHLWEQYHGFIQNNSCLSSSTMSLRPYLQFCATDFHLGVDTPWLFILRLFWQVLDSFISIQLLQKDVSLMWYKGKNFWSIKQMKMVMSTAMGHWCTCSLVSEGCAVKVLFWILCLSKYTKDEFFWNFSPEFTGTFLLTLMHYHFW